MENLLELGMEEWRLLHIAHFVVRSLDNFVKWKDSIMDVEINRILCVEGYN